MFLDAAMIGLLAVILISFVFADIKFEHKDQNTKEWMDSMEPTVHSVQYYIFFVFSSKNRVYAYKNHPLQKKGEKP